MTASAIGGQLHEYLTGLDAVADRWINWLERVERLSVENSGSAAEEISLESPKLMSDLEDIVQQRTEILQNAETIGLRASNLNALVKLIPDEDSGELLRRVNTARVKTSHLRRLHYATWVMVHQALQHSSDVLRLITSGKKTPDSYSSTEAGDGGGRLLNTEM